MISALVLLSGLLVSKERCHDYDCRLVKRLNHKCEILVKGEEATAFGITYPMKQSSYGASQSFHGQVEGNTLTMFFENGRIKVAYIAAYDTKSDYDRWTCRF